MDDLFGSACKFAVKSYIESALLLKQSLTKGNKPASVLWERLNVPCNKYWWHLCVDAAGTKFIGLIVKIPLPSQALQDLRVLVCLLCSDDTITPNKFTASGVMALISVLLGSHLFLSPWEWRAPLKLLAVLLWSNSAFHPHVTPSKSSTSCALG